MVFFRLGEDWIFLAMLGIIMALLSFGMDFVIEKCQEGMIVASLLCLRIIPNINFLSSMNYMYGS